MAQPAIKRTQSDANQASTLPNFLAPSTVDANQAETNGSGAETEGAAPSMTHTNVADSMEPATLNYTNPNEENLSDVDDHAMVIKQQINRLDMERLRVAAQLVNTFNHAIQVQAGRTDWNEHDYAAFIVALRSVDRIGYDAQQVIKK